MTSRQRGWLLPPAALCMLCGIFWGRDISSAVWGIAASVCALPALICLRGRLRFVACLSLSLSLGILSGTLAFHPALPPEETCEVRGIVCDEIRTGSFGQVRVCLSDLSLNDRPFSGGAWWTFYPEEIPAELAPGREACFTASLYHPGGAENPNGFDFRENLLRRGITIGLYGAENLSIQDPASFSLSGWIASLRHRLSQSLIRVLGEESGRYASALLLGMGALIPSEDRQSFSNLGIAHILSVSGFHVGILAGILGGLFHLLHLRQRVRLAASLTVLLFYAALCGMNPPVLRAAFFVLLLQEGKILNRPRSGLHLLCASMMVSMLIAPAQVTGASFQLSYAAMFALLWFAPAAERLCPFRRRIPARLFQSLLITFGIQLGLLLPELEHFQRLPLFSFLVNGPAMLVASAWILLNWAVLLVLPIPALPELLSGALSAATGALLSAVRALGSLPGLTVWIHAPNLITVLGIVLLFAGTCHLIRLRKRTRLFLCLPGLAAVVISLLPLPHSTTEYIQFSAGNADAAVLRDRDQVYVMDTGEADGTLSAYLRYHALTPDAVILTHLHTDHAGGLQSLLDDQIPIPVLYLPAGAEEQQIHPDILSLLSSLRSSGTEIRTLGRGDTLSFPSGSLTVLWPQRDKVRPGQDANDYSLVSLLRLRDSTLLHAGDLSGAYEMYTAVPADLLKVAHHGSASSTSADFLRAVSPKAALLSCRQLSRLRSFRERSGEVPVYATAACGAITVRFREGGFDLLPFLGPAQSEETREDP